jgi:hypothetical protein
MDIACKELQKRGDNLKIKDSHEHHTNRALAAPTDLINDTATTAQSLDLTSLQTSKYHPDFRVRNQHKVLKLTTILSDLHLHLSAANRTQNQAAFNDLCARITKAGEGLPSLAQPMPVEKSDCAAMKLSGEQMSDVCKSMKESEWYRVEHGGVAEEREKHDSLSLERVEHARKAYEASLSKENSEAEDEGVSLEKQCLNGTRVNQRWAW